VFFRWAGGSAIGGGGEKSLARSRRRATHVRFFRRGVGGGNLGNFLGGGRGRRGCWDSMLFWGKDSGGGPPSGVILHKKRHLEGFVVGGLGRGFVFSPQFPETKKGPTTRPGGPLEGKNKPPHGGGRPFQRRGKWPGKSRRNIGMSKIARGLGGHGGWGTGGDELGGKIGPFFSGGPAGGGRGEWKKKGGGPPP